MYITNTHTYINPQENYLGDEKNPGSSNLGHMTFHMFSAYVLNAVYTYIYVLCNIHIITHYQVTKRK